MQKYRAYSLLFIFLVELLTPTVSLALTSGVQAPELQSFQPADASNLVDLFTGDFKYNIPLMELPGPNGGYPINLFYNSVTDAEEEASFVGWGWNVGIGSISRQMRGVPDDFAGEEIKRRYDIRPDWTVGLKIEETKELFGVEQLPIGLELSFLYNNMRGFGVSASPKVGIGLGVGGGWGNIGLDGSFGLQISSLAGVSASSNLSLAYTTANKKKPIKIATTLGLDFSSREGGLIGGSLGGNLKIWKTGANGSVNSYIQNAYTPQIEMPMVGRNIGLSVDVDVTFAPVVFSGDLKLGGFFTDSRVVTSAWRAAPVYGAMYHHLAGNNSIQDINRENDAPVRNGQPNLAVPVFTTDLLSVSGQGAGGAFQLMRSDIPILRDRAERSKANGQNFTVEIGTGTATRVGVDVGLNWGTNETKALPAFLGKIGAYPQKDNSLVLPYYYRQMGEMSAEENAASVYAYMGLDSLYRLAWRGNQNLEFDTLLRGMNAGILPNVVGRSDRKPATQHLEPVSNEQLRRISSHGQIWQEYRVKYYNNSHQPSSITSYSTMDSLLRPDNKQTAAYTLLDGNGTRWHYALPVMNKRKVEAMFSVPAPSLGCVKRVDVPRASGDIAYKVEGTDKFLDVTETPAYAQSHLLTSVVGADYVDVDPTDGLPNDKDYGYWVRIEYTKTSNNYRWRSPFAGATYMRGLVNKASDDKGAFSYGEREQYYPARILSATHVVEFYYSKRFDARGAYDMLQNDSDASKYGEYAYKIDSIALFTQAEKTLAVAENRPPVALKKAHFSYNYAFCKQTENHPGGGGKMMLKSVHFTYEKNTRSSLNPYQFQYNNADSSAVYSEFLSDRWGVYAPLSGNNCRNIDRPFTDQNLSDDEHAERVRTWHLTDIILPSGAAIKIDVGRDHYSHEQDRIAGQIFEIKGVGSYGNNTVATMADPDSTNRRVYFDLQGAGIPTSYSPAARQAEVSRYYDDLYEEGEGKQLFFQINTDLFDIDNVNTNQDITGYAHIESMAVDTTYSSGGYYKRAFVTLKRFPVPNKRGNDSCYYHPFAIASWQFIRQNLTDFMYARENPSSPSLENMATENEEDIANAVYAMLSLRSIVGLFKNYYKWASERGYGANLHLPKSFIRLQTPTRKCYGDGVRVRRILLYDHWADEAAPVYGTVYDYDEDELDPITLTPTGRKISSGTATSTPIVGKQESALRYAKQYVEDLKWRQDMLYIAEYPLNESYFPAPSVGYRKVTVKSLATDYAIKRLQGQPLPSELPNDLPEGFATSGVSVHEFYTYVDFPIIVRQTNCLSYTNSPKRIPALLFNATYDTYAGSQAYSIELPDMHGKPKRTTQYGQNDLGQVLSSPLSQVSYEYLYRTETYTEGNRARARKVLLSQVDVLNSDTDPNDASRADIRSAEMGVSRSMFVDMRETQSESVNTDGEFNVEIPNIIVPFLPLPPMFFGSASAGHSREILRVAVTNKIIHRCGILKRIQAYDGQSQVTTTNLLYDKHTGQGLLTSVNNDYDDPIYSYTLPAHWGYEDLQAAYSNWGMIFTADLQPLNCGYYPLQNIDTTVAKHLHAGDEYILSGLVPPATAFRTRATLVEKIPDSTGNNFTFRLALEEIPASLPLLNCQLFVARSGKRNQLSASVGQITALANPTTNRQVDSCYALNFGAYTSYNQSICTPPAWADELVGYLNAYSEHSDSIDLCASKGSGVYAMRGGGRTCIIPAVDDAWREFRGAFEGVCDIGTMNSIYPSNVYPDSLKIMTNGCYLLTVQNGFNTATPSTTISAAALSDTLQAAMSSGNILSHELYGCAGSSPNTVLQILVRVRTGANSSTAYVMNLNAVCCKNTPIGSFQNQTYYRYDSTQVDSIPLVYRSIDKVLSISANTLRDNWQLRNNACAVPPSTQGIDLYRTGVRGLYRMLETWVYTATRNQSSPINTRQDGDMDDVPLFDWANPLLRYCSAYINWKRTTTVEQYQAPQGQAAQSANILEQHSAALHGYGGSLPIAVANNARVDEIAYEGFEEFPAASNTMSITQRENGNFRFIANGCTTTVGRNFPMLGLFNPQTSAIPLAVPYANFFTSVLPEQAVFSLSNGIGTSYTFSTPITGIAPFSIGSNTYPLLQFSGAVSCALPSYSSATAKALKMSAYTGTATLFYKLPTGGDTQIGIVDSVAHTGSKSLRLPANHTATLRQPNWRLDINKAYAFSAWVYVGKGDAVSYADSFRLLLDVPANTLRPSGAVIDGWQRIEGIVIATQAVPMLRLQNLSASAAFIDDVRLHPLHAAFESYLYDPVTYRLVAKLDGNNYFTRYHYDRQGQLISVQRETERGIKTLQESGTYLKKSIGN